MPIVHVNVWKSFGQEKIKTVIENITKVFVDLGIPAHAVEVIVHEIPKSHWGIGGTPLQKNSKIPLPNRSMSIACLALRGQCCFT